jgi:hypothetical protein
VGVTVEPRRRHARSFRTVALGSAFVALVIVAVAASLYVRFIHYERVAARHVPPGAVLAARLDVEQVALYNPVRRHVIPLFGGPGRSRADAEATIARLEERTGLKRSDLRELVVARGRNREDWVVVLGGIFPRGTSGAVLAAALAAEDPSWVATPDGVAVVHRELGVTVARADDGTVLVASSAPVLAAARRPSDTYTRLGLPPTGPGGFAFGRAGVEELGAWPPVLGAGDLPALLNGVEAVRANVTLLDRTALEVTVFDRTSGGGAATIKKTLEIARSFSPGESGPAALFLRAGAERARGVSSVSGGASATLIWERSEVDAAFALLAEAVQDHWR